MEGQPDRKGSYSVKSGYSFFLQLLHPTSSHNPDPTPAKFYKFIWAMNIIPTWKIFLWLPPV